MIGDAHGKLCDVYYTSMISDVVRLPNPENCESKSDIKISVGTGSKKEGKRMNKGHRANIALEIQMQTYQLFPQLQTYLAYVIYFLDAHSSIDITFLLLVCTNSSFL